MARVLIPFAEPDGARRAVLQLLREPRSHATSVHLLAAVEPRISGRIGIYLCAADANAQVRAAAARWLAPLSCLLANAGIAHTTEIVVGPPRRVIRAAAARDDVDRVLLPPPGPRLFARQWARRLCDRSPHPVTRVA
jgi:hypothetical protein